MSSSEVVTLLQHVDLLHSHKLGTNGKDSGQDNELTGRSTCRRNTVLFQLNYKNAPKKMFLTLFPFCLLELCSCFS